LFRPSIVFSLAFAGSFVPTCCVLAQAKLPADTVLDTSTMLATAAGDKKRKTEGLLGSVSLGYLGNTGNTRTSSLNAQLALGYVTGPWRHAGILKAARSASDGVKDGESYRATGQSDYTFAEHTYAFGAIDSNYDRFGSYQRRTSATVGLGRRLIESDAHTLDLQLGVGVRRSQRPGEDAEQEGIVAGVGKYGWKISEGATFTERVVVEKGHTNTYTESVSSLTANLQGSLALSVSYTVQHNSSVPSDRLKTDTATAISLLYAF
jgi:putative salt-induced outer membrane protein